MFKPDKKLKWLPQLGSVDISVELGDRTIDVTVPPLEAAIIELFTQKGTLSQPYILNWSLTFIKDAWLPSELSTVLKVDATAVRRALDTWTDQGVIREEAVAETGEEEAKSEV